MNSDDFCCFGELPFTTITVTIGGPLFNLDADHSSCQSLTLGVLCLIKNTLYLATPDLEF